MTFAGPGKGDDEIEAGIGPAPPISVESEGEARRAILAGEKRGYSPQDRGPGHSAFRDRGRQMTIGAGRARSASMRIAFQRWSTGCSKPGAIGAGSTFSPVSNASITRRLTEVHRVTVAHAGEIAEALGIAVPELNLGSGFDVPCRPGDEPLDIDKVAVALNQTLCNSPALLATTRFTIELGRWLVGEAGVYLTRVLDRTESCGHTFLTTDGGGHHLIGATGSLGQRGIGNFPIAVANHFGQAAEEEVTVTGCLCTPYDVLGDQVGLPRAEVGDLIAVFCAGAYGLSASPQALESRPLAREMLV